MVAKWVGSKRLERYQVPDVVQTGVRVGKRLALPPLVADVYLEDVGELCSITEAHLLDTLTR